jgi:hypothetical protein
MKRTARWVVVGLWMTMIAASRSPAQDDQALGQAFGRGNGVRGTVTAASPGSFTIRTDEGDTYQVLYSANSHLMKDRQPITADDIHVGDMLMAGGVVDAKAKTIGAVFLVDVDANQVRQAKAEFGKTWVMGKVTAIHELKITIERANDKQTQTLAVDENTSFRKRREDVTLADVKVGDFISAQGALHADTFVATTLRIMTPGAMGPGTKPSAAGSASGPPPGP